MRRKILALGMASLLVVVSACSSGGHKYVHPIGTVPGPNPDVVPAVITPAYVDAVFRVLNHINGNAARLIAGERQITSAAKEELRAIFADPVYADQVQAAQVSIAQGVIQNVNPAGGDAQTSVIHLISATSRCIFVETSTDLSSLLRTPTPKPASEYYELSPKQQRNDPSHINPTPWAISFNAAFESTTSIPSRC